MSFYTFVLFIGASLGPWLAGQGAAWSEKTFFLMLSGCICIAALYSAIQGQSANTRTA